MLVLRILFASTIITAVAAFWPFEIKTTTTKRPPTPRPYIGSLTNWDGSPKYGYWNITIRSALAISDDIGDFCDLWTLCDAYVKIKIDGREVWRSKTHWNQPQPKFFETYRSPRIKKGSRIVVEMWDDDKELVPSNDDFMDRWWSKSPVGYTPKKKLIGRTWESTISPNKLFIDSRWIDE